MKSIIFVICFLSTLAVAQDIQVKPEMGNQIEVVKPKQTIIQDKPKAEPVEAPTMAETTIKPQTKVISDSEKIAYKKGVVDAKKFYEAKSQKESEEQKRKDITMVGELELLKTPTITVSLSYVPGNDTGESNLDKKSEVTINFGANMLRKTVENKVLKHINLLSAGFNISTHTDVSIYVSPINFTFTNGFNAGVGFQMDSKEARGGSTMLMGGFEF